MDRKKELNHYIHSWNLQPDGEYFFTHSSLLQPVLSGDTKAMLKILLTKEEKRGIDVLTWWNGKGAAKVLKAGDDAVLMERITGDLSLRNLSMNNRDSEATEIMCETVKLLHSHQKEPLPELTPLTVWFEELLLSAAKYGDAFVTSAKIAQRLLSEQQNVVVLHGDIHHDNILYSSQRGWLAIDPKGLLGERTFDYVNILCNPTKEIALKEERLMKQTDLISRLTGIETPRLLQWTATWAGLSAVWFINGNEDASIPAGILKMVIARLSSSGTI